MGHAGFTAVAELPVTQNGKGKYSTYCFARERQKLETITNYNEKT